VEQSATIEAPRALKGVGYGGAGTPFPTVVWKGEMPLLNFLFFDLEMAYFGAILIAKFHLITCFNKKAVLSQT